MTEAAALLANVEARLETLYASLARLQIQKDVLEDRIARLEGARDALMQIASSREEEVTAA